VWPAFAVVVALLAASGIHGTLAHADTPACSQGHGGPTAELFATDNTAVITDPNDTRLRDPLQLFELQADETIAQSGGVAVGSTLVDGVFWSDTLSQTTYERSREFHVCGLDDDMLRSVAHQLRRQFHQESVLTFEYLPLGAPASTAAIVEVPDIDLVRFHDALVTDVSARDRIAGGSVSAEETLILVADTRDLDTMRRLVGEAGGQWLTATVAYGKREFVGSALGPE
jgi:hypothetical protein